MAHIKKNNCCVHPKEDGEHNSCSAGKMLSPSGDHTLWAGGLVIRANHHGEVAIAFDTGVPECTGADALRGHAHFNQVVTDRTNAAINHFLVVGFIGGRVHRTIDANRQTGVALEVSGDFSQFACLGGTEVLSVVIELQFSIQYPTVHNTDNAAVTCGADRAVRSDVTGFAHCAGGADGGFAPGTRGTHDSAITGFTGRTHGTGRADGSVTAFTGLTCNSSITGGAGVAGGSGGTYQRGAFRTCGANRATGSGGTSRACGTTRAHTHRSHGTRGSSGTLKSAGAVGTRGTHCANGAGATCSGRTHGTFGSGGTDRTGFTRWARNEAARGSCGSGVTAGAGGSGWALYARGAGHAGSVTARGADLTLNA